MSSYNVIYMEDNFKVTKGTPKRWTKKADGGNEITSCFWYVFFNQNTSRIGSNS